MASNRFAPNRLLQSDMTRFLPRFFALLLCGLAASPAQAQLEFEHDGLTRTYFMDAPDPIPAGVPLCWSCIHEQCPTDPGLQR